MFKVGRMCVKLAGRDAGQKCVIVDKSEDGRVVIDGQTRRRKVNTKHLQPLMQTIDIKKGASHSQVKEAFEELGLEVRETEPHETPERPKKSKVVKEGEPQEEPAEEAEAGEEEIPSRSTVKSMTKDEIKEYAADEWNVELSTNDLKDEMIDQLFDEIKK